MSQSSCRGLFRLGSKSEPSHIHVLYPGGHSLALPIEDYVLKQAMPDWTDLPTDKQYKVLLTIAAAQDNFSLIVNPVDAEECVQSGWLETLPSGFWILTAKGKEILG